MFGRKEYLLRLYKDLHPEDHSVSEDDLTVVTIDNVFTVKSYNDLGFMVAGSRRKLLVMVEAQSKWSTNVIIRIWDYLLDTIMNYFINYGDNLYESARVEMPDVETYIVYTGKSEPKLFGKLDKDDAGRCILSLNREFFEGKAGHTDSQISDYLTKEFNLTLGYARNWLDAVIEEEESNIFA